MKFLYTLKLLILGVLTLSTLQVLAVNITDSRNIKLNAYVGEHDTKLSFDSDVSGIELYRSKDKNCDINNIVSCASGQYDILGSSPVIDTVFTQYTGINGLFVFKEGDKRADIIFQGGPFEDRQGHQVVFFNNKLMAFGGINSVNKRYMKFMYYSLDNSATWSKDLTNGSYLPLYGERLSHKVVEFKNKLWMIGGGGSSGDGPVTNNDIWSSLDGSNWVEENPAAEFSVSSGFDVAFFAGKLWVIGTEYNGDQSKVWSSEDGVSWSLENGSPDFGDRSSHQVVAFNGKLWVIGGRASDGPQNDVWSSSDGAEWTLERSDAEFSARFAHQVVVHGGALILAGGREDRFENYVGYQKDVWRSEDGVNWQKIGDIPFGGRAYHQLTSTGDKLVTTAGSHTVLQVGSIVEPIGDSWISDDGIDWSLATHDPDFGERKNYSMVEYADKLWLFGGSTYDKYKSETWSSDNGLAWQLESTSLPVELTTMQTFVYNDRVWLVGRDNNYPGEGHKFNFWSSDDVLNWTEEGALINVPYDFEVEIHDGRIFVMYRESDENVVITSSDSTSWEKSKGLVPSGFPFAGSTEIFNGKIWKTGGYQKDANGDPVAVNDIWSSLDGLDWTLETASAWRGGRWGNRTINHDGKLWVIGGRDRRVLAHSETWSSEDGVNWVEQGVGLGFRPEQGFTVVSFKNQLLTFAGRSPMGYHKPKNRMWVYDNNEWRQGYQYDVNFGLTHYDLRTAEIQNGSISPQDQSVLAGSSASFDITPANGYMIDEVSGCDGELDGNVFTIDSVLTDCTLAATFVPGPVVVTTRVTMGRGVITPEYSEVPEGTMLTLTVTADKWYAPYRVQGCNGTWSAASNSYTVGPLIEDCEVTASFRWDWW